MLYLTELENTFKAVLNATALFFFDTNFDRFFEGTSPVITPSRKPAAFDFKYIFIFILHAD
jgi:hypothetical protein